MKLQDLIERISIIAHIERFDETNFTKQILEDSSKYTDQSERIIFLENSIEKMAKLK